MPLPALGGRSLRIEVRLAHVLGRGLAEIAGQEDDPWIPELAARLRSLTDASALPAPGEERGAGGEQAGENPVLELEDGV